MDTGSFIVYIKTDDIYKDIAEDVGTRFDTYELDKLWVWIMNSKYKLRNYESNRPFPKGKNKIVIGLMKDGLVRKIMIKFVGLRAKTYSYVINDGSKDKKQKVHKKRILKFENYKNCLQATQLENKIK